MEVTTLHIFGIPVDLIGFQGGIIVALLIGIVTAKLDIFFEKKVPEVIRLLVSPLLTTLVSSFLLFMIIGPVGRGLANGITAVLVWMTQHLGVIGYAAFSGVQQLIVITGLHHVFGAIESQLLVDTGRNFLNPLMSVAIIAQGGAVLGYLARNMKDAKAKELCIPSFISVLFGITENILHRSLLKRQAVRRSQRQMRPQVLCRQGRMFCRKKSVHLHPESLLGLRK